MTQITVPETAENPLISRIVRLRGRVRAVVGMFGAGVVLAAGVGGLFLLMLADYMVHMPGPLRQVLLLVWVVALGVLTWRYLVAPLTARLTDQFLASRVENLYKPFADELMSAVHFIHTRAPATNALAARQVEAASRKAEGIRFEDALDYRQAGKSLGAAALIAVIVVLVAAMNPALARVAASRWLSTAPMPWPRSTHVALDWSAHGGQPPKVIPMGEKFTVRAKVDRGSQPRVWLYDWSDSGKEHAQLMTFQREQSSGGTYIFETSVEPEGKELSLRVEAGDDDEEQPITIRLAPRPVITQLQGEIAAPAYVTGEPGKPIAGVMVNLMTQAGRAAQGAMVTLRVRATKPFLINDRNEPEALLYDQNKDEQIPLSMQRRLAQGSINEAELVFAADKTLQARLMMRDSDGFENRVGGGLTIEVVPDALPSIVITEPRRSIERASDGVVEMTILGTDDWGFAGLKMRADKFDAKESDPPAFEAALTWDDLSRDAAAGIITGKRRYTWELSPLHLAQGARLTFYGLVKDNYKMNGQDHPWVKSAPLSLQIRSAADILETQRKALAELNERLKNLKGQQEQTRAQTDSIRKIVSSSNLMTADQRTQLSTLSQQESQESATAGSIQQRADQIADDLRQNRMAEAELGKIALEVSSGMQEVGQQNMPRAAANLSQAQESRSSQNQNSSQNEAQQSTNAMTGATQQQDQAIATMDRLIRRLGATGDFETLRGEASRMLSRQQELNRQTRDAAPRTAGIKPESLPKDLHDNVDRLARDQKDLKEQTADLIDRMEQARDQLKQSDPASAESLQNAAQTGRSGEITNNQDAASSKITSNNLNNANNNQTAAAQGLQRMLDELNKNDLRKLEQLVRDIRKLIQDVQKLRDDEALVNKDSDAAGATAATAEMQKLGNRQGTLQQNAIIIQKKAQATSRAGQAANFIGEASDHMVEAATALFSNKQPDALKPETDAIGALDLALEELKKVDNQISPDLRSKQLAEYIKKYEQIKQEETSVKDSSDKYEVKRQASVDKELDRLDEMKVRELAKSQAELITRVKDVSEDEKMREVEVVVWMNGQVTQAMDASKGKLEKVELGKPLAFAQQSAIDRLQMIIDALREEAAKPSEFNGGGGGGGGGGGQPPLVPPVAELKLLKAMQLVVNGQTKVIEQGIQTSTSNAQKDELRGEARELGSQQGDIRGIADHIAEKLQGRGRGPAGPAGNGGRGGGRGGPAGGGG